MSHTIQINGSFEHVVTGATEVSRTNQHENDTLKSDPRSLLQMGSKSDAREFQGTIGSDEDEVGSEDCAKSTADSDAIMHSDESRSLKAQLHAAEDQLINQRRQAVDARAEAAAATVVERQRVAEAAAVERRAATIQLRTAEDRCRALDRKLASEKSGRRDRRSGEGCEDERYESTKLNTEWLEHKLRESHKELLDSQKHCAAIEVKKQDEIVALDLQLQEGDDAIAELENELVEVRSAIETESIAAEAKLTKTMGDIEGLKQKNLALQNHLKQAQDETKQARVKYKDSLVAAELTLKEQGEEFARKATHTNEWTRKEKVEISDKLAQAKAELMVASADVTKAESATAEVKKDAERESRSNIRLAEILVTENIDQWQYDAVGRRIAVRAPDVVAAVGAAPPPEPVWRPQRRAPHRAAATPRAEAPPTSATPVPVRAPSPPIIDAADEATRAVRQAHVRDKKVKLEDSKAQESAALETTDAVSVKIQTKPMGPGRLAARARQKVKSDFNLTVIDNDDDGEILKLGAAGRMNAGTVEEAEAATVQPTPATVAAVAEVSTAASTADAAEPAAQEAILPLLKTREQRI